MESITSTTGTNSIIKVLEHQLNKLTFNKKQIYYKRPELIKLVLKEEDIEKGYLFGDSIEHIYNNKILSPELISNSVSADKLEFYFYNCESIRDLGWGCAWRCMQIVIGTVRNILLNEEEYENCLQEFSNLINFDNRFDTMFYTYGGKQTLLELFLSSYNKVTVPEYLLLKEFAPFETEQGWAEPFTAKLILHDLGIEGDLFLVNRYLETTYAPIEVFEKTISYDEFKEYLLSHFNQENENGKVNNNKRLPIIIDDTLFTFCILGAYLDKEDLILLVADPHVKNVDDSNSGIYHVRLNSKGNIDLEKNTHPMLNGRRFNFETGSFMVYAPKTPFSTSK